MFGKGVESLNTQMISQALEMVWDSHWSHSLGGLETNNAAER